MSKYFWLSLLVLAFALAACGPAAGTRAVAPVKNSLAPDFELQTLGGKTVSLSDYRGQPVLLNFWATWCTPCRQEMPAFQSRYEQYAPDLMVLAVNFDETPDVVQDFMIELGLTFDPLLDSAGDIKTLYEVRGFPTTFFIDAEGVIQAVHIGIVNEALLDDYLADIGLEAVE